MPLVGILGAAPVSTTPLPLSPHPTASLRHPLPILSESAVLAPLCRRFQPAAIVRLPEKGLGRTSGQGLARLLGERKRKATSATARRASPCKASTQATAACRRGNTSRFRPARRRARPPSSAVASFGRTGVPHRPHPGTAATAQRFPSHCAEKQLVHLARWDGHRDWADDTRRLGRSQGKLRPATAPLQRRCS